MERFYDHLHRLKLDHCRNDLEALIHSLKNRLDLDFGNEKKWRDLYQSLPDIAPSDLDFSGDWIRIGCSSDAHAPEIGALLQTLKAMNPWRKGPFNVFGITVDSEWASYIKWNRLKDAIAPLEGRRILDIGCSSGYYMFKMLDHHPEMILGIDPQLLFYYQFKALQKYIRSDKLYYLPAKLEELPPFGRYFDTVFFMGIIYHRKSPVDSLNEIRESMKTGGELVLETLIIEDESPHALFPVDRYAKMRNVFFIPSVPCLEAWLKRSGFDNIHCLDISKTSLLEQRKTEWINTESLDDFLDPRDPSKTVEGYPAPVRAIITARAT
ncbi:MAG: tRNA 5-methoxyuridine(34)/uridine 5-oxyacetic acid(34) synthase CmoB [Proteobacteria bacterium]|nr:tRNA 5-methoxyuridine(34)/uridine 5-oxyacetic acid(34) synthase CmoB [Pseudomonadota bacterium]